MHYKLEIVDTQQMRTLLEMNIQPDVFTQTLQHKQLIFNYELILKTREFVFQNRKITYIYLISFLSKLTKLDLQFNTITDISTISYLKNLKSLNLSRNRIVDISALQSLSFLTKLNVACNLITSYKIELPNLVDLNISFNILKDKSGLLQSPKLRFLNIVGTNTTNLKDIPKELKNLNIISVDFNQIQEISYIINFLDLQLLELRKNDMIKDIEPLKECVKLKVLDLSQTSIVDIQPLQFLKQLCVLRLNKISITNIQPLKFLKQLKSLYLNDTPISDIWPLQFMKNLQRLELQNTNVIDLHPLQYLYQLEHVLITHSFVVDVAPLSSLIQLDTLILNNNKILNFDSLRHHDNYPQPINIQNEEDDLNEPINEDEEQKYFFDNQIIPTTKELKFYNNVLQIHCSHKQIRKIRIANKCQKFRDLQTLNQDFILLMFNNQIIQMNKEINLLLELIRNSYSYFD
ncbi:leucine-rich_repeat domain-containing protein [Hexamita inflata]|uniref:Leucine-rich repeat domain-containing protein n=1 Tax=Hexamita inflata TaxID=28002 RepID=A0AA86NPH7_9EUKA|nr:leucine-rich repeat domain-containing protein [Hexamita inflata]